jgi:hypothetical protein
MIDPRDNRNLSCEQFQALLPELIGSGEDISSHPHLQSCALCSELLAELETIAEAARQLFPTEEPPDDLWNQIESAIRKEERSSDNGADPAEAAAKAAQTSTANH